MKRQKTLNCESRNETRNSNHTASMTNLNKHFEQLRSKNARDEGKTHFARINSRSSSWSIRTRAISPFATVPGRYRCGFLTPPAVGALLRAALVASCFRGAFPPVDFRLNCLSRAMMNRSTWCRNEIRPLPLRWNRNDPNRCLKRRRKILLGEIGWNEFEPRYDENAAEEGVCQIKWTNEIYYVCILQNGSQNCLCVAE